MEILFLLLVIIPGTLLETEETTITYAYLEYRQRFKHSTSRKSTVQALQTEPA